MNYNLNLCSAGTHRAHPQPDPRGERRRRQQSRGNLSWFLFLGLQSLFFQVDRSKQGTVVGLGAPAGAAVLRRLEQRRRLHKVGLSTL